MQCERGEMSDKEKCPLCKAPVERVKAKTEEGREFTQLLYKENIKQEVLEAINDVESALELLKSRVDFSG